MGSRVRDVFPPDNPVARFVVSISGARNALETAVYRATAANEADDPEFWALALTATGYLHEGCKAVGAYRTRFCEVQTFLAQLPAKARQDLTKASGTAQQVGGRALGHARDSIFHFPHPGAYTPDSDEQLREVLASLGDEEAAVAVFGEEGRRRLRLEFADHAMLALATSAHAEDRKELRRQVERTHAGATAFVRFVDAAALAYLDATGATIGEEA